jgi:hypothetical protein
MYVCIYIYLNVYIYIHTHSGYPYKANIRVKATYTSSLRPPILVAQEGLNKRKACRRVSIYLQYLKASSRGKSRIKQKGEDAIKTLLGSTKALLRLY